jgi:hypothetical protein
MSNDFAVFRLADIILMKAEAQLMNGNVPDALATINQKSMVFPYTAVLIYAILPLLK